MIYDALLILWNSNSEVDEKNVHLSNTEDIEIFSRICDIAKSHRRIQNFIKDSSFQSRKEFMEITGRCIGLYSQALSEGINEVLQEYKNTLVEVESTIINNHNYTMLFIYSNVEKYVTLFNVLNKIITSIKDRELSGCQILSLIHQHILTGNELVHKAIVKIFSNINSVFINQLCSWLLYGELKDPYQEFFIQPSNKEGNASDTLLSTPSVSNTYDKPLLSTLQDTSMECGYNIYVNMIPYFMPLSLAQEILFIGKTVILFGFDPKDVKKTSHNYFTSLLPGQSYGYNEVCRFTIWKEKEASFHDKLQKLKQPDFEIFKTKAVVSDIKECVTKHLWVVAVEEAHLIHELRLIKDFYLLGRGELFLELLRLSAHSLDNPTTRTSTRDINQAFQTAARSVFLSNNADIEKFRFELPYTKPTVSSNSTLDDDSSSSEADGWSSIILKYNFKWPLHLLFTPEVLARYNDMFRLLLRIKKTQHDLHALWMIYKHSKSFAMCQLHNKLMFLMDNLQHYLQADVLESNFSKLMEAVSKTSDFGKLKHAHAMFLADILSQSFLIVTTNLENDCPNDSIDYINNPVICNIMDLLKLCHSFCSMSQSMSDKESMDYYLKGFSERFDKLVNKLKQLLISFHERPCGVFLARLLMRLDYNGWLQTLKSQQLIL